MKLRSALYYFMLPLSLALGTACSSTLTSGQSDSAFLVTEPDADGRVFVIARGGTVQPSSRVALANLERGVSAWAASLDDGSMFSLLAAGSDDRIEVKYTDAEGTDTSEELSPQEGLTTVHGLLTMYDADGEEGEKPPCWILIRDDIEGEGAELEVLLAPPRHPHGPPPQDGSQPPPQDGSQPPPQDGSQPPPQDGSQPPPQDGSQPPPPKECKPPQDGSQPPQDGSQPPPQDGSQPPPCKPPMLAQYVDQYVTVVGAWLEPRPDQPCEGTPFSTEAVIADETGEVSTP